MLYVYFESHKKLTEKCQNWLHMLPTGSSVRGNRRRISKKNTLKNPSSGSCAVEM